MVVLHPDHIAFSSEGEHDLGKGKVDGSVGEPVGLVKVHLSGVVMEQRPEDRVGETAE